jgi:tRNA (guanine-N7-)-methyltransferase
MSSTYPEQLYGRRKGRPLKTSQQLLMDAVLKKFALEPPSQGLINLQKVFADQVYEAFWLEIGFGGGEHLVHQAERYQHVGFIGAEAFVNGVASLARLIEEKQLSNVRLFLGDGRHLLKTLPAQSIRKVVILFPDPWPKLRHHKRRLINEVNLLEISRILGRGGELRIASDHQGYIQWILEKIRKVPQLIPQFNPSEIPFVKPKGWESTRYEEKALSLKHPCYYLSFCNVVEN